MKGDKAVIKALNDVLMAELTAINIYYIQHPTLCTAII